MTEVRESRTSAVGPGQRSRFLVLTKRSAASGDKNVSRVDILKCACVKFIWACARGYKSVFKTDTAL